MCDTLVCLDDVFRNVFDDDDISLTRFCTAKDVDGWDSLMHVTLLINVERAFGIKFSSSEVAGLKNVGEMVDLIDARQNSSRRKDSSAPQSRHAIIIQ